jgi:thioredoxin reductase/NAD-dependent dihydropyrimidine dehydrogenase PreA subunit
VAAVGFAIAAFVIFNDSARAFGFFRGRDIKAAETPPVRVLDAAELAELGLRKYRGPEYPHPVIFPDRCIGCQACVDACPHDVLAIVDGRAKSVAPDLCMEDTACQAECPVNPKACIIINTTKTVRSLPAPVRDGATFQTNVEGCYIIGDVSGVPLIKNAVKEGYEVITRIADELKSAPPESKAEHDVAIIGIGPGGASAAITAQEAGLKYVGIEQEKIHATIEMYPKGKYIFFKPDTKDWFGGLKVTGLGLAKAKYGAAAADDYESVIAAIDGDLSPLLDTETASLHDELIQGIPRSLQAEASPLLAEKLKKELKRQIAGYLRSKGSGDWTAMYRQHFGAGNDEVLAGFRSAIADQLKAKIPGDQRENILAVWHGNLADHGVAINEQESCKTVSKADDGDYFVINTERGTEKAPQTYRARRVVIAIGLRGAPNKLRLPNEEMKIVLDGREQQKVIYSLTNPAEYRGKRIAVVGGGNSAVEAAVDLAAKRVGTAIEPRPPEERNQVTLLVRDYLAPTVKFGNKFQLYQCADDGILELRFGVAIKEMRETELVLSDVVTGAEVGSIPNDIVFALIGGERPDRFLKSVGIEIV